MKAKDANRYLTKLVEQDKTKDKYALYHGARRYMLELRTYEMAEALDLLFKDGLFSKVSFQFEDEYNDEGGTYLSINAELSYLDDEGDEDVCSIYSGQDVDEVYDDLNKELTEEMQNKYSKNLNEFLELLSKLDREDVEFAHPFYNKELDKDVLAVYRGRFPETFSVIEHDKIERSVSKLKKDKPNKQPLKM